MAALSAMVTLEIPHVNIMTKMDLLSPKAKKEIEKYVHVMQIICNSLQPRFGKHNFFFILFAGI